MERNNCKSVQIDHDDSLLAKKQASVVITTAWIQQIDAIFYEELGDQLTVRFDKTRK